LAKAIRSSKSNMVEGSNNSSMVANSNIRDRTKAKDKTRDRTTRWRSWS
jgi:hypothetical protein